MWTSDVIKRCWEHSLCSRCPENPSFCFHLREVSGNKNSKVSKTWKISNTRTFAKLKNFYMRPLFCSVMYCSLDISLCCFKVFMEYFWTTFFIFLRSVFELFRNAKAIVLFKSFNIFSIKKSKAIEWEQAAATSYIRSVKNQFDELSFRFVVTKKKGSMIRAIKIVSWYSLT